MDNKNLFIAIGLSIVIMVGFQHFFAPEPIPPTEQTATQTADGGNTQIKSTSAPGVDSEAPVPKSREEALAQSPRLPIDTARLSGSIDLHGAKLNDLILRDYRTDLSQESPNIVLLAPRGSEFPYFASVRWLADDETSVPDRDTLWKGAPDALTADQPVTLHWDNGQGQRFEIDITVDQNYMFTLTQRVINSGNKTVRLKSYGLVNRVGIPQTSDNTFIVHEGPVGVFNETYKEVSYDTVEEAPNKRIEQTTEGGWTGIFDKYWTVLLIPEQDAKVDARFAYSSVNGSDTYQVDISYSYYDIAPGDTREDSLRLFAGAREPQLIDYYTEEFHIDKFYLAVDYGWIFFLARPIYWLLNWFHGLVGNFGGAILLLVVCVRIALFPLANKAYKSMAKMRKLQPRMLELRERYKDDKPRFQKEMMGLYKKEGANPVAGCLPMLLQIPIFIALYNVLYGTILMRHAPFVGWIQDLSAPDPTSWVNLFGLLPFDVPNLGLLSFFSIGIWPLLMGFTMWAQYRLNPQPTDPLQAKIFAWMPVIFTFMLGHFAAGLVIYWAWNNLLSMGQQAIIMRSQGIPIGGKLPALTPIASPPSAPEPEPKKFEPKAEAKVHSSRPSKGQRRSSNPAAKKRKRS
ncbi:MAG: membrane protein insertase YidC [Rhodospirillales bacterium]|nr:membrane protein insertase YidC [Rhodospirillales bacterium]